VWNSSTFRTRRAIMSPLTIPASFGCCISLTPRQLSWLINKNKSPRHPFSFVVLAQLLLRADKETSPPYFARPGEFQNKKKSLIIRLLTLSLIIATTGNDTQLWIHKLDLRKNKKKKKPKTKFFFIFFQLIIYSVLISYLSKPYISILCRLQKLTKLTRNKK
jgi:hypothetical protein